MVEKENIRQLKKQLGQKQKKQKNKKKKRTAKKKSPGKKNLHGVKITCFTKIINESFLNYIYYSELPFNDNNNITMNITENNSVDRNKYAAGVEYLLCMCRLKPKI